MKSAKRSGLGQTQPRIIINGAKVEVEEKKEEEQQPLKQEVDKSEKNIREIS